MRERRTIRIRLVSFACVLAGTALACQLVLGLDEPQQGRLPDAAGNPCVHARPPPPEPSSPHVGPEESYWMVMTSIAFPLVDDAGVARGYDLDEACTCAADLHDGAPPCTTLVGERPCDTASGIDNTFATTLAGYATLLDLAAAAERTSGTARQGVLLYLSQYNGEANDDEVGLTVVPTVGLFSTLGCDGRPRPDAAQPPGEYEMPIPPTHDGCDHWKVPEDKLQLVNGVPVPLGGIVSKAYVSGYTLVAPSKSTLVSLVGRGLTANDGVITGHLEAVNVGGRRVFRLSGGIGTARSPMNNFVDLLAHTRINASTGGGQNELCRSTLWTQVKQQLCASLDTMSSPAGDFQGESCNAFSVAWGFTGEPIYLDDAGRNYRPDPPEIDCGVIATPEQLCGTAP